MANNYTIRRVGDTKDQLGEGPLWDVEEQALYWLDSCGPTVHRLDPATGERYAGLFSWNAKRNIAGSQSLLQHRDLYLPYGDTLLSRQRRRQTRCLAHKRTSWCVAC
jgi:sugar lactone lactonase YvrE